MTATIGTLSEFILEKETISAYLECVEIFLPPTKQLPVLLTAIERETYALLHNLLTPAKCKDFSTTQGGPSMPF